MFTIFSGIHAISSQSLKVSMNRKTSLKYSTDKNIQAIPESLITEAFQETRRVRKLRCIYRR